MYTFSIAAFVIQLISILLVIFVFIGIGAMLRYFSWRKKQAAELNDRLDRVIDLLERERG